MTSRELPVLLVATTLVLSALFTFAINSMLGGTVKEAPLRATPAANSTSAEGTDAKRAAPANSAFPDQAGTPRNRESPSGAKRAVGEPTPPANTPDPTTSEPSSSSPPASAPPAPISPPPAVSQPAPVPQQRSTPAPKREGEDFYSTG